MGLKRECVDNVSLLCVVQDIADSGEWLRARGGLAGEHDDVSHELRCGSTDRHSWKIGCRWQLLVGVLKSLEAGEYVKLTRKSHKGTAHTSATSVLHPCCIRAHLCYTIAEWCAELKLTSEGLQYSQMGSPEARVFNAISATPEGSSVGDATVPCVSRSC